MHKNVQRIGADMKHRRERHRGEKAHRRKGAEDKGHRGEKGPREKARRKGTSEMAWRKMALLEKHYLDPCQCYSYGAFYSYTKEPLIQFLHLNAFNFRCKKWHCSVPFPVPLKKHIPTPLEATNLYCERIGSI